MSFGGFLENKPGGSGGGARIVADIPYSNGSNHNNDITMPSGAISQTRLATPTLAKSMFNNSPGLSLALVRHTHTHTHTHTHVHTRLLQFIDIL